MKNSQINSTLIAAKKTFIDNRWSVPEWTEWEIVSHEMPFDTNKTKLQNIILSSDDLTTNISLETLGQFIIITEEAAVLQQLWKEVW